MPRGRGTSVFIYGGKAEDRHLEFTQGVPIARGLQSREEPSPYPNLLVRPRSSSSASAEPAIKVPLPMEFRRREFFLATKDESGHLSLVPVHQQVAQLAVAQAGDAGRLSPEQEEDADRRSPEEDGEVDRPSPADGDASRRSSEERGNAAQGRPFHDYLGSQLGREVAAVKYFVPDVAGKPGSFGGPVQELALHEPEGTGLPRYPFVGGMEIHVEFAGEAPATEAPRDILPRPSARPAAEAPPEAPSRAPCMACALL